MSAWWDEDHKLCLLTPAEITSLPDGTIVTAIDDDTVELSTETRASIDMDTRCGHTAWGVTGDHPMRLALLARTTQDQTS